MKGQMGSRERGGGSRRRQSGKTATEGSRQTLNLKVTEYMSHTERVVQSDGSFSDRERGRQVQQDHVRQKQRRVRQSDRE